MNRRVLSLMVVLPALAGGADPGAAAAQTAPSSGGGGADEAVALLESASRRYERMSGFCAEFEQERIVPLLDQTTRSRGTLCQMHPGYFLMDFSQPEGDRVVSDGESLWIYYPSMDPDQVIRTRLGSAGSTFDFHAEFLDDPGLRFDVRRLGEETVTGRATRVLSLRPRARAGYERATVWLERERGLIRKVEIEEENESVRRVVLSDIRVEPGLEPADFAFELPRGVRILDRTLPPEPPR